MTDLALHGGFLNKRKPQLKCEQTLSDRFPLKVDMALYRLARELALVIIASWSDSKDLAASFQSL